jgi:sugar O-acyltransferase (sialic acid O-acetyltransferase NeuD family)
MSTKILIFGGSGHAKDLMSVAIENGYQSFEIVTTDGSSKIDDIRVTAEAHFAPENYRDWDAIVAIGDNAVRKRLFEKFSSELCFVNLVAPSATVSPSAVIGRACYIGPFCFIAPDARIGDACIVNAHSIVGHDAKIGSFSHISPQVCISGHVELGDEVFVGAGAKFNNGSYAKPLTIADRVHIGMGCSVTRSIKTVGAQLIPKPNYLAIK